MKYSLHRRSQDFLYGCTFYPQKLTTFLIVAVKTHAKTAPAPLNLPPPT